MGASARTSIFVAVANFYFLLRCTHLNKIFAVATGVFEECADACGRSLNLKYFHYFHKKLDISERLFLLYRKEGTMPFTKEKTIKPLKRDSEKAIQFNHAGISLTNNKKKFRAVVRFKNRRFDLGVFNTEKQAIDAYVKAKKRYARLFNEK